MTSTTTKDEKNSKIFYVGDIVELHSLQSDAGKRMNGSTATVLREAPQEEETRYECHIRGWENTVAFRPQNLKRVFDTYRVGPSATHGLGLIAMRKIQQTEEIFYEHPLCTDVSYMTDLCAADKQAAKTLASSNNIENEWVTECVMQTLKQKKKKNVTDEEKKECLELMNVYFTNAYAEAGLVLVLSRANHDCDPNCLFEWDEDAKVLRICACKDIDAGEEIKTSYCADFDLLKERQEKLKATKGFECKCQTCEAASPERDKLLQEIRTIHDIIPTLDSGSEKDLELVEKYVTRALVICQQVGGALLPTQCTLVFDLLQIIANTESLSQKDKCERLLPWLIKCQEFFKFRSKAKEWEKEREEFKVYVQDPERFLQMIWKKFKKESQKKR